MATRFASSLVIRLTAALVLNTFLASHLRDIAPGRRNHVKRAPEARTALAL